MSAPAFNHSTRNTCQILCSTAPQHFAVTAITVGRAGPFHASNTDMACSATEVPSHPLCSRLSAAAKEGFL